MTALKKVMQSIFWCIAVGAAIFIVSEGLALLAPGSARSPLPGCKVYQTGLIANPALLEASGMVCSRSEADLLWVVNDAGNPMVLFAVKTDGGDHGRVIVEGALNTDWEDLAIFEREGKSYILIADVGDNHADRETGHTFVVKEPVRQTTGTFPASIAVEWHFRFCYESGPRNCESVVVDNRTGEILLLTKRITSPHIYTLPLKPSVRALVMARHVGEVPGMPMLTARDVVTKLCDGVWPSQPTALDSWRDNRLAVVLMYKDTYLFPRAADETWATALAREPWRIRLPKREKQETACFSPDGRMLYVSTEKRQPPLLGAHLARIP